MGETKAVIRQPQSDKHSLELSELPFAFGLGVEQLEQQTTKTRLLPMLNKITVKQRLHKLEVCFGCTRNNRYCVYTEEGDQIYYVYEDSVCLMRQMTGALRGLILKMTDEDQEDVLIMKRPARCSSRCFWSCCSLQVMDIIVQQDKEKAATIYEVWSCCIPQYRVVNKEGSLLWRVKGGTCHYRCCSQIHFEFLTPDGERAAAVNRECQGCDELIGASNTFSIHYDLDARQRLIILGSTFLVDLNYFEKQNRCW
ncbi:phospholipid scramblase 1-like isoform X2 [Pomacea canaliculata]|uniref:phospholipid scramblase 1-like isoform X2 n=1 Tax=Pomacea canaliculata TaxID=400727 RepID=UPI000D72E799|nr:phospholipid scramblase 1-like isoform X2 [Pomacea canaliculata]